jgi:putative tryptophan/tyrosine transport system substrate-binding protein
MNFRFAGYLIFLSTLLISFGCSNGTNHQGKNRPRVGFLDFIQDPTIELAKTGFFDALAENGFSESDTTLEIIYANAQGDIPTLNQSCDFILSQSPDLIATNVTLSTITAVKRTRSVPVFMMVSPRPDIAGLNDPSGNAPPNLSGVYETLDYLDSSVVIIKELFPGIRKMGTVFNQSEPQSGDAYQAILKQCRKSGIELISLPVNNSSETQLVTQTLLTKGIEAFFALPDNVIFASFETISRLCDDAGVPVFTSEAGLVRRGALASYGADFYLWGFQSGQLASQYLISGKKNLPPSEIVQVRMKLYNPEKAQKFNIIPDSSFKAWTH